MKKTPKISFSKIKISKMIVQVTQVIPTLLMCY